jgi:allantoin racemase
MRILVLNPNTSTAVTDRIEGVIRRIARPGTEVRISQIAHGPEVLESYYDECLASSSILESVIEAGRGGYDAIVLAAFCDPALEAAKEISSIPVYGLEETSFSAALLLGNKFGILTEKKHKVAVKQQHVRKHGLQDRFASVRPLNMGVAEIATEPENVKRTGIEICRKMVEEDGAEVIILGCASMAGYADEVQQAVGVPILDPVAVTFKTAEALTEIGVRHSKIGLYARPAPQKLR